MSAQCMRDLAARHGLDADELVEADELMRGVLAQRGRWLVVFPYDGTADRYRSLSKAKSIVRWHREDGVTALIRRYRTGDVWYDAGSNSLSHDRWRR